MVQSNGSNDMPIYKWVCPTDDDDPVPIVGQANTGG